MDAARLFLETLDELEQRVSSQTEYDLLMAAGLLRKLLLDASPLVVQANRSVRMKLEFAVTVDDLQLPPELPVPDFHARMEGISPRVAAPPLATQRLPLDRFLQQVAVRVNGRAVTVHQVVDQVAHIEGGVHTGEPKKDHERLLSDVNSSFGVNGVPMVARTLRGIGLVVVDSMRGLAERLREV